MKRRARTSHQGWTRFEALAVLLALGLLGVCLLPLLASPARGSRLAGCANNLKLMGEAMRSWANDHGDRTPAWTPWAEGGTMPDGTDPYSRQGALKPGGAWIEWLALSNHLATPEILVCPADPYKRITTNPCCASCG